MPENSCIDTSTFLSFLREFKGFYFCALTTLGPNNPLSVNLHLRDFHFGLLRSKLISPQSIVSLLRQTVLKFNLDSSEDYFLSIIKIRIEIQI